MISFMQVNSILLEWSNRCKLTASPWTDRVTQWLSCNGLAAATCLCSTLIILIVSQADFDNFRILYECSYCLTIAIAWWVSIRPCRTPTPSQLLILMVELVDSAPFYSLLFDYPTRETNDGDSRWSLRAFASQLVFIDRYILYFITLLIRLVCGFACLDHVGPRYWLACGSRKSYMSSL